MKKYYIKCSECQFYKNGKCDNSAYFLIAYNAGARGIAPPPYETSKFCNSEGLCSYGLKPGEWVD